MVTLKEVEVYYLACEEFEAVGQEDAYTLDEVLSRWGGMTENDACGFAIYGYPTQLWLNLEAALIKAAGHKQEWVNLARTYARALQEQYEINLAGIEKIERQLADEQK